jgi:hypothetical protein
LPEQTYECRIPLQPGQCARIVIVSCPLLRCSGPKLLWWLCASVMFVVVLMRESLVSQKPRCRSSRNRRNRPREPLLFILPAASSIRARAHSVLLWLVDMCRATPWPVPTSVLTLGLRDRVSRSRIADCRETGSRAPHAIMIKLNRDLGCLFSHCRRLISRSVVLFVFRSLTFVVFGYLQT